MPKALLRMMFEFSGKQQLVIRRVVLDHSSCVVVRVCELVFLVAAVTSDHTHMGELRALTERALLERSEMLSRC